MLRVGLTGGLASGKSTVARMLEQHAIPVLDADQVARQLLNPGTPTYQEVVRVFGPEILTTGEPRVIDRSKLAAIAFDEARPRVSELNSIVHPAVIAEEERWIAQLGKQHPNAIAVVEAALLFEAGSEKRFDKMIVITAPEEVRVQRFAERAGTSKAKEEARRRIAVQMPEAEKTARADYVLENGGSIAELSTRVDELLASLRRDAAAS